MFEKFRTIDPKVKKTKDRMEFIVVEPQMGDYIMIGTICTLSVPLSYYTTPNISYFFVCLFFYWILAYSLLEDRYVTVIDKKENTVEITKSKMGKIEWIRASAADELINAEVVPVMQGKRETYRFELEFMSDFGYYRLVTSDTLIVGDHNKKILEELAKNVMDFMKLKPIPDWMTEEKLQESFNRETKVKKTKSKKK